MDTLTHLEELLAKATPGPWEATERSGYHEVLAPDDECDWYCRPKRHAIFYGDTEIDDDENIANAALIVEAINALPALIARIRELEDRGAQAVIAYHVAICSPKGVVPVDDLYDPVIAAKIEREMGIARRALAKQEKPA